MANADALHEALRFRHQHQVLAKLNSDNEKRKWLFQLWQPPEVEHTEMMAQADEVDGTGYNHEFPGLDIGLHGLGVDADGTYYVNCLAEHSSCTRD